MANTNANTWVDGGVCYDPASYTGYSGSCYKVRLKWNEVSNGDKVYKVRLTAEVLLWQWTGWAASNVYIAGELKASGNIGNSGATKNAWVSAGSWSKDIEITKQTYAQSKEYSASAYVYGGPSTAKVTVGVPTKTSYTVSYDANGGSNAPANQTKWYDDTLTLSGTIPTRPGFAFKGWSGSNGTTYQPSGTYATNSALTLTAIWQALVTDLEDVDDIEIGEAPVLAWTPQDASLVYYVDFELGEWSYSSQPMSPGSTDRYVYNAYTIPMTVCSELPDQTEGVLKVTLETWDYTDIHNPQKTGESIKYCTASVPDSVVPTIDSAVVTDVNLNPFGLLQNYSMLNADIEVSSAYSSPVVTAVMSVGEQTVEAEIVNDEATLITDVLTEDGTVTITVTITDARGRSAQHTEDVTVLEYSPPTLSLNLSIDDQNRLVTEVTATYHEIGGANSGSISYDGGLTWDSITPIYTGGRTRTVEHPESRNHSSTVIVQDAVTSVTVTQNLYPDRGNRFSIPDTDQYYIGIDDRGWKDIESAYEGGIHEDGTIWFQRTSGDNPLGIGFPVQLEEDCDYEIIYAANKVDDDTAVFVSFFSQTGDTEDDFHYLGNTVEQGYLRSGETFHTAEGTAWGMIVMGVDPQDYELTPVGFQTFKDITIRKIERTKEPLEWMIETGNLGLGTPNQKYIGKIQLRIDYIGTLQGYISYDNDMKYTQVHNSASTHIRSITMPINVKRCDHFRIRLTGIGQAKLYSMGYITEDGSERCLI